MEGHPLKIAVLDGYTLNPGDLSWEQLSGLGELTVYDRTAPEQIVERAAGAQVVLTNKTPLRSEVIKQLPELQYIGVMATGYDIIDLSAAKERGIIVTNVPEYSTDSVAQLVLALLLELCHQVGAHSTSAKGGDWASSIDFSYWHSPLIELSGKTMGIIGYGRIGARTAALAKAFGMNVIAAASRTAGTSGDVVRVPLEELLRVSDVVSLHCPLTPDTEKLINEQTLSLMKPEAFLINTSRGKLIDEYALAEALRGGRIAGAAVDVLSAEPPRSDHPLLAAERCIVTPHIAWATKEARERLMNTVAGNVKAHLAGSPVNVIV